MSPEKFIDSSCSHTHYTLAPCSVFHLHVLLSVSVLQLSCNQLSPYIHTVLAYLTPILLRSGAGIAGAQSIQANVHATQPVAKFATPKQQREMLPKLISGEWRVCIGV